MFCNHCGKEVPENARFCSSCGAKIMAEQPAQMPGPTLAPRMLPRGIFLGRDGKYRWTYAVNSWTNGAMLATILKFTLGVFVFLILLMFFINLGNGAEESIRSLLSFLPIGLACTVGLMLVGYVLMALINGGRYQVIFTMDNEQIVHAQAKKQAETWRKIAAADFFLTGDITTELAACASEKFVSCYKDVKTVCIQRKNDLIRLNEVLVKNQIYAAPEQYDFVLNYIVPRCANAKIKEK